VIGMANGKGLMTTAEAGHKGGVTTARTHGRGFYQEIGRKGGRVRADEIGPKGYKELGSKGGQTTSSKYGPKFYSEIGRKGGKVRGQQLHELSQMYNSSRIDSS